MKKGLLSLLALALTVVGCQNYDDQFDTLTTLIEELQTEVEGLPDVTSQITQLQNTVAGLATAASVQSLQNDVDGLATASALTEGLDDLQEQIDDILAALDGVATQEDLDAINDELADIQADLDDLLEANSTINQDVVVRNLATLKYAESLIATGTDAPAVIVNGNVIFDIDESDFDAGQVARANDVAAKLSTVLGSVTVTNTFTPATKLTFSELSFVDAALTITGDTNLADGDTENDELATITGDLTISDVTGSLNLSDLTSAANITVPTGVSELFFGSVEADSFSTTGSATGELQLFAATTVDAGESVVNHLYAPQAGDVDVKISSAVTETIINAERAGTIDLTGNLAAGKVLTLTGTDSTIVHVDALTAVGTITSNKLGQLHVNALASAAHIDSDAVVAALGALASVSNGIEMHGITDFNAPALDVSGVVSVSVATDITVKDVSSGYDFGAPKATDLTISALADTNEFETTGSGYDFGKLTDLTVTGVADSTPSITSQTNVVSSSSAVLANVTVNGMINEVSLTNGTKLAAISTDGFIRDITISGGGTALTALSLGHEHIEGSDAASLNVSGNSSLASLETTSLDELGTITIEDNAALASFNLSSFTTLPQLGSYVITLDDNNLAGNYVEATVVVTTTAARIERIRSASLVTLKPIMALAAASAAVNYSFSGEILSSVTTSTRSNVNDDIVATSTNTSTLDYLINNIYNVSTIATGTLEESDFTLVETL